MKKIIYSKWFLACLLISLFTIFSILPTITFAATTAYNRTSTIGGGANSLDSINGDNLSNNDIAFVMDGTNIYFYILDAANSDSESDPDLIKPDDNPGTKRWVRQIAFNPEATDTIFKISRPLFTYSDTDTIIIGPGGYYLAGIGWVYWTENIEFDLGSGGSNANSDNLTNDEWHYIALDYSEISAAGILTDSNFINREHSNIQAGINYDGTKGGVYQDTNDRTIFGVFTNSSAQVLEFFHSSNTVFHADEIENQAAIDIDTAFTDIGALIIPKFTTLGILHFRFDTSSATWVWRTNGSAGSVGTTIGGLGDGTTGRSREFTNVLVLTDVSQIIEVKADASDTSKIIIKTQGWKFPIGM